MKMKTKLAAISAIVTGSLCANVSAADIEAGVVKTQPKLMNEKADHIDLGQIDLSYASEVIAKAQSQNRGPASGIEFYEIFAVGSSTQGWKYPNAWQTSTVDDHGGSLLRVATIQYGYGNPNPANMNGISKSSYGTDLLCGSLSNLHFCNTGETVTGFIYYFNFDGQQSGTVNTSANSTAFPFGYWSDSIYIR